MSLTRIAILGATSHIAKGLIYRFLQAADSELHLFSRSIEKLQQFLVSECDTATSPPAIHQGYTGFSEVPYDVIINCCGAGTQRKLQGDYTRYFTIGEETDNLILDHMTHRCPEALYISFSSGAVYGKGFSLPADDASANCIAVNHVAKQDYYGIVRLNAEAKHRAHEELRIIDLRIFSYFSRHINLTDGYFITDVIQAVRNNTILHTDSSNIVRDYLHPDDLYQAVCACMTAGRLNRAIDLNSARPVAKQEILDYFSAIYGLKYEKLPAAENVSATGTKANYYSTCSHASCIGFTPHHTSMDSIRCETEKLLAIIQEQY